MTAGRAPRATVGRRALLRLRSTGARLARRMSPAQRARLIDLEDRIQRRLGMDTFGIAHLDVASPSAFGELTALEAMLRPIPYRLVDGDSPRVNVLLPRLDRALVFGGYIAVLHFIGRLQDRGWHVRIVITEDVRSSPQRIREGFAGHFAEDILAKADIVNAARTSNGIDITRADRFVAYSMWSAIHAHEFSSAVGRRYVHFAQEYEPIFHAHDSLHAVGAAVYALPHFAIFNSEVLRKWFEIERVGVYRDGVHAGDAASACFEHALSIDRPPTQQELSEHGPRRVLVYARPEAHASRNLFPVIVLGLRAAVAAGVFDGDWEFHGIGSLATTTRIDLGRGHTLALQPRMVLGSYAEMLRNYSIGLSMQYAPHPGVVHYEMAASGVITVTNTFSNRSAADLRKLSANLVPVEASPAGVAAGLATAVTAADDIAGRVGGATRPWVTSWTQSFDDQVMERVEAELHR